MTEPATFSVALANEAARLPDPLEGCNGFVVLATAEFLLSDSAIQMDHMGIWFADPNDAAKAGCPGTTTPFDGDHNAGILVFSTSNSADADGPLRQLREIE